MNSTIYDIDCELLLNAMKFYAELGYQPIKAPMLVDLDILNLTLPNDKAPLQHLNKYYVGSAEQSFYQLIKNGLEAKGSYMLITPCERDEDFSESHLNIFMKLELISVDKRKESILNDVVKFYISQGFDPKIIDTEFGFDININQIEVGSFGDNIIDGELIVHGTGLALPRISYALEQGFNL